MNGNDELWKLMARKLAGEASPEELERLQQLLDENPDAASGFDEISKLWYVKPSASGQQAGHRLEQRLLNSIQAKQPEDR